MRLLVLHMAAYVVGSQSLYREFCECLSHEIYKNDSFVKLDPLYFEFNVVYCIRQSIMIGYVSPNLPRTPGSSDFASRYAYNFQAHLHAYLLFCLGIVKVEGYYN